MPIHQPIPEIFKNKRLIAVDLETTGLHIKYNTIIEIGCVEVNNGKVVLFKGKEGFTKMFGGGHSSMYLVRKVHRIKDSERVAKKKFKDCAQGVSEYLSNAILVTHNGNSFDIPMLQQKLTEAGFPLHDFKSIDTLQLVRKMRKKESGEDDDDEKKQSGRNTLGSVCREFGLVYGGEGGDKSHRGLEDAEACLDVLFYLVNNNLVEVSV